MNRIFESDYKKLFEDKKHEALDRAWKNRDFEIERYWQRATYFWAFTASAFAGYFALLSSKEIEKKFPQLQFIVICLGLVFSVAWLLVNYGSKKWQTNWEKHIDMLEDDITGPIYKVVINTNSYSVSNLNIIVNWFVISIWIILAISYLAEKVKFNCDVNCKPDLIIIGTIVATLIAITIMIFGHGRTGMNKKTFYFIEREIPYDNSEKD